jgi:hypothetical protein
MVSFPKEKKKKPLAIICANTNILNARMLALGYGSKRRSRKKRENVNFTEYTVTINRSK